MVERSEVKRLTLQIERDVLARGHLSVLMAAADATLAGHRQALRNLRAQIARDTRRPVRSE
jgi:hypothetical protein